MSGSTPRTDASDAGRPHDWFLPAIACAGTVGDCLASVLDELDQRALFIRALKVKLELGAPAGLDSVTDLGLRSRALENTLRFRLGILRPERPAAWFRAPAVASMGPFASTLLAEPVFGPYEPADADYVREQLDIAWRDRSVAQLPFKDHSSCLWGTLLGLAAQLEQVVQLPAPFAGLRLDQLPDQLPPPLESRALRAFLINVRTEVLATYDRLAACYRQLRETSEKLWCAQAEAARECQAGAPRPGTFGAFARSRIHAEDLRQEFRRRRSERPLRAFLMPADMEALKFMGFEDLPTPDALRQRYLAMAKRLHPDREGGNDQAFKVLSMAYAQLTARVGAER